MTTVQTFLTFFAGMWVGGIFGFLACALFVDGKREDEAAERALPRYHDAGDHIIQLRPRGRR